MSTLRRDPQLMFNLSAALAAGNPIECTLEATVTDDAREFYGNRTHAEHEDFHVEVAGRRLEVVENLGLAPLIPVKRGDQIELHGELVPHGSHGPLMHWIHRSPNGHHESGYCIDNGQRYE
jgi:hypothetical protein